MHTCIKYDSCPRSDGSLLVYDLSGIIEFKVQFHSCVVYHALMI